MTTELCLFCNEPEQNYQPGPDADFICSNGTRPEHKSVKRSVDRKGIARSVRA